MQEVAVVQGLQAQVVEVQVAPGLQRRAQARQVELLQPGVEQFGAHAGLDELGEVLRVAGLHVGLRGVFAQHLAANGVQQQPGGGARVGRVFFDQGAGGQDGGLVDLVHRHAVIQVAAGLGQNRRGQHALAQVAAGRFDQALQAAHVQWHPVPFVKNV